MGWRAGVLARMGIPVAVIAGTLAPATPVTAQERAATVGATLRGWEQRTRLALFDRSGSFLGRLSAAGILQRFSEQVDHEYDLDLISSGFSLSEEYDWFRRGQGARFWAGSINHRRLVQEGEVAATVPLDSSWSVSLDVFHHRTIQADRSLVLIGFARELFDDRGTAFLSASLKEEKPDADLELGFRWAASRGSVTLAVGALDLFSDFIYQTLEVFAGFADTAIDYTRQPIALRGTAELTPAPGLRAEAFGLVLTPTRLSAERQRAPGEGFRQDERYGYAGGLVEWSPSPASAVGAFGTWVRARLERDPLAAGVPEDAFDRTEKNWQLGLFGLHRFGGPFAIEGWAARLIRTHDRSRPPGSPIPDLDYEDRAWWGRLDAIFRPRIGFRGTLGIDFVDREVVGPDRVETIEFLGVGNWRLRLDLGWAVRERTRGGTERTRALFVLGSNFDLDGDPPLDRGVFDGAHGRFVLYW